jgi:CheY-like chemotaxis protein
VNINQRLLWIDDNVDKFGPWIQRFGEQGVHVDTGRSINDAYTAVDRNQYGAIFLDQIMPSGEGTEAIPRLAVRAPHSALFICSAFFYVDQVMAALDRQERESGRPIGRIDKTSLPMVDDPEAVSQFLVDVFAGQDVVEEKANQAGARLLEGDLSLVPLDDYAKLDITAKLDLHDRVSAWTKDAREALFSEGFSYIVFCGDWTQPIIKERDVSSFHSEEELLRRARQIGYAPFVFSNGGTIDDFTRGCSARAGLRGYPALMMDRRHKTETVHLDTGNSLSLLSHKWYTSNGWLDNSLTLDTHFAGEMELRGKHQALSGVIFTDSSGRTLKGQLSAFAVINWDGYRIAATCMTDCQVNKIGRDFERPCNFRTALLGRSLADDLRCDFEMNLRSGAVLFRNAEE